MGKEDCLDKALVFERMKQAIVEGNRAEAESLAREAVRAGLNPQETIEKGYVPGIRRVGELWEEGEYFLPELVSSAESMKAAMSVLQSELGGAGGTTGKGRLVIGTIEGDIHDIGKNLVASMLQANGFEVHDLGADVKLEKFLEKAEEVGADGVCLSALLTTTMLGQRRFIQMIKARNLDGRFKVMVGGAPVTRKWAEEIGADGYAENAVAAVKLAQDLLKK